MMKPNRPLMKQIKEIFAEVRGLPAGEERDQLLTHACGSNAELRKEVESLLEAYESASDFLSRDVIGASLTDTADLIDTMINEYRLVELIGEGGFGEVYRAEQTEPLRREVALKVIKLGMDSKNVVARFEAERQALARMNHPGIAQVYNAGVTETGRPFFVMELVRGVPFIDYCDQHRLSLSNRLDLFRLVCDAVQHAHQKGVLHRDLKPSNILVTEENGKPRPKIIDFGVAKSLRGRLTEQTLATLQEMLIGTPLYMSPEQLNNDISDIDTRSDIYSLGIILYELVAGAVPLEGELPSPLTIAAMREALHKKDIPRPSRRFHALGPKTTTIANERRIKPPTLERLLRGDLDWVVMKAIEKERDRRYDDVGTLSLDLERYLNHKPVLAGPPSLAYRARKFVRRHRTGTAVAASLALSLILGTVMSSIGFIRAKQAAEQARIQEIRAGMEAERARKQKAITEATYSFFTRELVSLASPFSENADSDIKLRAAIDQASAQLVDYKEDQPEVCSRIHRLFSELYIDLGDYDKALFHARQSMALVNKDRGKNDPAYLEARLCLADAFFAEGHKKKPRNIYRSVLEIQEQNLGPNHPDTLSTLSRLAPLTHPAIGMYQRIAETKQQELGPEHLETLHAKLDLASHLSKLSQYEESEDIYLEIIPLLKKELNPADPAVLSAIHGYSTLLLDMGKPDEAEPLLRELLEIRLEKLGPEHPDTLGTIHNLAIMHFHQKQYAEAEKILRKNLATLKRTLGPDHPQTLSAAFNLGYILFHQNRQLEEVENLAREVIEKQEKLYGQDSWWTWPSNLLLAKALHKQGKHAESERAYRRLYKVQQPHQRGATIQNIANELRHQGKSEEAEQYLLDLQEIDHGK